MIQHRNTFDWRAVAIFPRRSLEPKNCHRHRALLGSEQFTVLYLEDLLKIQSDLLGIQIMQLIVAKPKQSQGYIQKIAEQLKDQTNIQNQAIIELVNTVMVYKFPELSWEVIEAMFSISELKQTRVYRDAVDEGRTEEAQSLILRLLTCRIGPLDQVTEFQIRSLSLSRLEDLGEALLEFSQSSDLSDWLTSI